MNITREKARAYIKHHDLKMSSTAGTCTKARPIDVNGVYKTDDAYKLEFSGKKEAEDTYLKIYGKSVYANYCFNAYKLIEYLTDVVKLLPKGPKYYVYSNDWWYDFKASNAFSLLIFCSDDFVQAKPTNKELVMKAELDKRNHNFALNDAVFTPNLIQVLKDKGYDIYSGRGGALYYKNKAAFSKLHIDALNYFMNNVILPATGIGCKMPIPKKKGYSTYKWDDPLCYIGDLEMIVDDKEKDKE